MDNMNKTIKILAALALCLALALSATATCALAAEQKSAEDLDKELDALLSGVEEHPVYHFPEIPPEYSLTLGGGYGDITRSPAALRFSDEKGFFPVVGGEVRLFEFPHRFYFVADIEGKDDMFGEMRYAYSDILLFRWVGVKLWRDVEHVSPRDLDRSTLSPTYVDMDPNFKDYGVTRYMENMYLRLKSPDYAAHLYVKYFFIHREGDIQEKSLQGSGWFNDLVLVENKKHIDWHTNELTYGLNSHLGPMEAELNQTVTSFTVASEPQSFGQYAGTYAWAQGSYPHHLTPDFSGLSSSLQLHTSYTGRIVAAATLTAKDLENDTSGAKSNYLIGTGDIVLMPMEELTLFAKYRRKEVRTESPAYASITDYGYAHTYIYGLKEPLDSSEETLTLTARGRLTSNVSLTGEYRSEHTVRDNAEIWGMPTTSMRKDSSSLNLKLMRMAGLDITAGLKYTNTDNPAYNTDADKSMQVSAQAAWNPNQMWSAFISYKGTQDKRDTLEYNGSTMALNRISGRDTGTASLSFMPVEGLSLTGSYSILYGAAKQDLLYYDGTGTPMVAPGVSYRDKSQCYALSVGVVPNELLSMDAGVNYNWNDGRLATENPYLKEVAGLLDYKFAETAVTLGGTYKLDPTLSMKLSYKYADIQEKIGSTEDGLVSGSSQVAMLTLTKKW